MKKERKKKVDKNNAKLRIIAFAHENAPIPEFIAIWFHIASKPFFISFFHYPLCSFLFSFSHTKKNVFYVILINVISWLDCIASICNNYPCGQTMHFNVHTIYATAFLVHSNTIECPFTTSNRYKKNIISAAAWKTLKEWVKWMRVNLVCFGCK